LQYQKRKRANERIKHTTSFGEERENNIHIYEFLLFLIIEIKQAINALTT
jgi:hypothetical protein